ncbi:hypothetical protein DMB92_00005 [Campylobacter sp. MIT 99-7217]|uniref:galactosyltransferase-related protein n=1 Tax=Campylobacter sp. MIT 99-7217 TaxID=535091 RepID=UPI00115A95C7|nr:galactosyltransferase-related protein [Campylobacter sp. MIT 99-7217]TQR34390.1 hypothetical protein DMB92_00005 [Campylobacter sp. MIT 99-7217]
MKLSIIIPFGTSLQRAFIKERVEEKANFYTSDTNVEFIFVEGFSSLKHPELKELILKQGHIYLKDEAQELSCAFSQGECRNLGARHARAEAIMFLDVDCYLSLFSLQRLLQFIQTKQIAENENKFLMLPCLYLSKEGSTLLKKNDEKTWDSLAQNDLMSKEKRFIQNFALASSLIVYNKQIFLKLKGFSDKFIGHGYEDFEFLLRFLRQSSYFEALPKDLSYDSRTWDFSEFKGFRALFSLLGYEGAFYGIYALHFWHENPNQNGYLDHKEKNHQIFYEQIKEFEAFCKKQGPDKSKNQISLNSLAYTAYKFELGHFKGLRLSLLSPFITKLSHTKFYRLFKKLKKDPKNFFKESKNPLLKIFFKENKA